MDKIKRKTNGLMLLVVISVSLLILDMPFQVRAESRNIDIYVIKASDSPSSFVGNPDNVVSGVLGAREDAIFRTRVKLAGEQINSTMVTSTDQLLQLVQDPPSHAIFLNTHGEVIPLPNKYLGPKIEITCPPNGFTLYSPDICVSADVQPPPGYRLQYFAPGCVRALAYSWNTETLYGPYGMNPEFDDDGGRYECWVPLPDYGTYTLYVWSWTVNGPESIASIEIHREYATPAPNCPFLWVWNGTQYVKDNNVLRLSEVTNGTEVVDYYRLEQPPILNADGKYALSLMEWAQEQSFFDHVQLLAIDHASNISLAVSPDNRILTHTEPSPPASALTDENENVKHLLSSVDGEYYEGFNGSYVTLNFGDCDITDGAKLVLRADRKYKKSIFVQVQDKRGDWNTVAEVLPRACWTTEIIDMSQHLPDGKGNLKIRLYFTANHKVDFAGLDTSPPVSVDIKEATFVSAKHSAGIDTTLEDLQSNDGFYAELTPGQRIELTFDLPEKDNEQRDFIFVVEGRYKKVGDAALAVGTAWQSWFELLEDRTRNYGWIWANVAGYSAFYFGNAWYASRFPGYNLGSDLQQPRENGLRRFLTYDVSVYCYDGHWARRGYHFAGANSRMAFDTSAGAYDNLPDTIQASRPIATADLLWDLVGYVDDSGVPPFEPVVTASITMNGTNPGIFVHNGLAEEADDWMKGYIATALAIEEARAYLMSPASLTQTVGHVHGAVFSITMLPGGWGESLEYFPSLGWRQCRFVELVLTTSNHYESSILWQPGWDLPIAYSLSVADFKFSGTDDEVWASIDLAKSGWETGALDRSLNDRVGWWTIGLAAGTLSLLTGVPYLGSVVGMVPLLESDPSIPETQPLADATTGVWANGTCIDPNEDEWGTTAIYFKVMFIGSPREYTFTLAMKSWLQSKVLNIDTVTRAAGIYSTTQLHYIVSG